MSEDFVGFKSEDAELRWQTLLKFGDTNFDRPSFTDMRALKALSGKTTSQLAALVGVDPRSVRAWTSPPQAGVRQQTIPYSAWRLLLLELRIVDL